MFVEILLFILVLFAIVGVTMYAVYLVKRELSAYAKSTELGSYAKNDDLRDYAKASSLNDYLKTSSLSNHLSDYAKTSDMNASCQQFETPFADGVTDPVNYLNNQILACPSGQTLNGMQVVKGGDDDKQFAVKYTCCGALLAQKQSPQNAVVSV